MGTWRDTESAATPPVAPAGAAAACAEASAWLDLNFDGHRLRVVLRDGRPWFAADDALALGGLRRPVLGVLAIDQRDRAVVRDGGRRTYLEVVNVSGLYALLHVARQALGGVAGAATDAASQAQARAEMRRREMEMGRLDRLLTHRVQPILHAAGWLTSSDVAAAAWCREPLTNLEVVR